MRKSLKIFVNILVTIVCFGATFVFTTFSVVKAGEITEQVNQLDEIEQIGLNSKYTLNEAVELSLIEEYSEQAKNMAPSDIILTIEEQNELDKALIAAEQYIALNDNPRMRAFGVANWIVAGAINIAFSALLGGTGVFSLVRYAAKNGWRVAQALIYSVVVRWATVKIANTVIAITMSVLHGLLSWNIGNLISVTWDSRDRYRNNGYCNAL